MTRWPKGLGALSLLAAIAMSTPGRAQGADAGSAAPATQLETNAVPVQPKPAKAEPAAAESKPPPVKDLWVRKESAAPEPARAPLVFSSLDFVSFGVDVNVIRTDRTGNAHLGGELSFIPWISDSVWWLGFNTWYSYGFIPKVNRIATGMQFGRGPFGLELAPVLFTWVPGDMHLGVAGTLFLVIPPWYSRPEYSAGCCKQLSGPQRQLRSCGCDRNLHAGYFVPYFRLEVGQEIEGRRQDAVASFFGVRVKYGYGY